LLFVGFALPYGIFYDDSREDWYRVQKKDLLENYGGGLLQLLYRNSPSALIMSAYSDFPYLPWKFSSLPQGYWDLAANRKAYVDWLVGVIGAKSSSELTGNDFSLNHGATLLEKYHNSPAQLIKSLSSSGDGEHANQLKMRFAEKNYWNSRENRIRFLSELATKVGFTFSSNDLSNWYSVSIKDFQENGGMGLLSKFQGSPYKLLKFVFPDYDWQPWKFRITPHNSWQDPLVVKTMIQYLEKELAISTEEEWRRVAVTRLHELGLADFFLKAGGLATVLHYKSSKKSTHL